ncbi:hypothetical protein SDC9_177517 [bioreactor metagenome]|uniref:Uncharacterized protein n=1 Tax=bioreactor metagenome TaxID=1076179 RepID=A0A645GUP4_9ZZZZ
MITISKEAHDYIVSQGGAVHLFEAGRANMC